MDLSGSGISAVASTEGTLNVNLPNSLADGESKTTSLKVYDSQGTSRLITFTYTKITDNQWEVSAIEKMGVPRWSRPPRLTSTQTAT